LKRIARLAPAMYLMLGAGLVLGLAEYREGFWWHALFLSNIQMGLSGEWAGSISHLWSLAKQEQFYLLWPLLLLVPARRLGMTILLVALCAVLFRVVCIQAGAPEMFRWMLLPGSLDAFAVGGLIALSMRARGGRLIPEGRALPACAVALAALSWTAIERPSIAWSKAIELSVATASLADFRARATAAVRSALLWIFARPPVNPD
jgi:peptidoglycan/LPS O-acetylase OafA/YrhL